jgi:tyrosyl-tRNA synthetase
MHANIYYVMNLFEDLHARGLIHDSTDPAALAARLETGPVGVYVGFDPTADSLHVGHLMGQLTLRRFQLAGHRPFPLAGGATGMVGDPGGRSEERNLLSPEVLEHNVNCISAQLEKILDFEPGPYGATLVNNAKWTASMGVLDFLRDVGKHMTVNQMMAKDSVRSRINSEHGISYTEFSYMLLQANDFRHLYSTHQVEMQMGGSDQWGNITAGIDLIRRTSGGSAYGLTWPLLLKSDGTKFGKTAGGSVWLDPTKTSPYQFRQFWMRTEDDAVADLLMRFSMRSVEDLSGLISRHGEAPHERAAQRALADELTALVHGDEAARAAAQAAEVLFGSDPTTASRDALAVVAGEVTTSQHSRASLPEILNDVVALITNIGLAASKSEARRLLQQKSVRANGLILEESSPLDELKLLQDRYILIRRGKTEYRLMEIF